MGPQHSRMAIAVAQALAGATVLTANTRAARRLRRQAEWQSLRERQVCPTPDVLTLDAWVNRTWTDGLVAGVVERALLQPNVVAALWEQIVASSPAGRQLMSHAAAAELAGRAWKTVHDYKLPRRRALYDGTVETSAFHAWMETFESRCRQAGWVDAALALESTSTLIGKIPNLPKRIVVFGFDSFTPLQRDLWSALEKAGCEVLVLAPEPGMDVSNARAAAFESTADEIGAAAMWARKQLETNPSVQLGIIVPGLEGLRNTIETAFASCLHPESLLLQNANTERSFEISLGRPLAGHPAIRCARRCLALLSGPVAAEEFSGLLRSRYLDGGTSEASARAMLDYRLRKELRATTTLNEVYGFVQELGAGRVPKLLALLKELHTAQRALPKQLSRSEWAATARRVLAAVGWPGDGEEGFTLGSEAYQATNAWDSLLSDFGALDQVMASRAPAELQRELDRAASAETFAAENESAPIQVVGPIAASGECFDKLWFCGLSDEAWPQRGHPNPFLPFALQKEYGVPHATAEANLHDAELVTARLLQSADDCVLSWPQRDDDREMRPSTLLARVPVVPFHELEVAETQSWNDLQKGAATEEFVDEVAPSITNVDLRKHGTYLLQWQAGCPFRAFAQVRLAAEPPMDMTLGANALDRGKVTELALQYVWEHFRSKQNLEMQTTARFESCIDDAVQRALAEAFPKGNDAWLQRHREIERERLTKLMHEWLEVERTRADFDHIVPQKEINTVIGGVEIHGRADRVEQTVGGEYVIIDYKTGGSAYSPGMWEGDRPDDPQLPIYAVAEKREGHEIAGVGFARVRAGKCRFSGESAAKEIFGNNRDSVRHGEFRETVNAWAPVLEKLAGDLLAGHAEVDPKNPPGTSKNTCRLCHLESLCRIAEFAAINDDDVEEVADDE